MCVGVVGVVDGVGVGVCMGGDGGLNGVFFD